VRGGGQRKVPLAEEGEQKRVRRWAGPVKKGGLLVSASTALVWVTFRNKDGFYIYKKTIKTRWTFFPTFQWIILTLFYITLRDWEPKD
jgi:hypothetical protein